MKRTCVGRVYMAWVGCRVTGAAATNRALDGDVVAVEVISTPVTAHTSTKFTEQFSSSSGGISIAAVTAEASVEAVEGLASVSSGQEHDAGEDIDGCNLQHCVVTKHVPCRFSTCPWSCSGHYSSKLASVCWHYHTY